jgi:hypothetical protein
MPKEVILKLIIKIEIISINIKKNIIKQINLGILKKDCYIYG